MKTSARRLLAMIMLSCATSPVLAQGPALGKLSLLDVEAPTTATSSQPASALTSSERTALEHLLGLMPSLTGRDARFHLGEVEPVIAGAYYELVDEVVRDVTAGVPGAAPDSGQVSAQLDAHRAAMTSGLQSALRALGVTRNQPDTRGRVIPLSDVRRLPQDLGALAAALRRQETGGAPRRQFVDGIGPDDVRALLGNAAQSD